MKKEEKPAEQAKAISHQPEQPHVRRNLRLVINESKNDEKKVKKDDDAKKQQENSKKETIISKMTKLNSNIKQKALKESF